MGNLNWLMIQAARRGNYACVDLIHACECGTFQNCQDSLEKDMKFTDVRAEAQFHHYYRQVCKQFMVCAVRIHSCSLLDCNYA